jgi:hypothetical protein
MIRIGQIAKEYLEAGAMSSLIGLFGFVDEHTFLTKSGELGVVFRAPGVDVECLDHSERDQIARRFEGAVRALDERFRIYQYLLKRDHAEIPHRHYENAVVEQAISKRIFDIIAILHFILIVATIILLEAAVFFVIAFGYIAAAIAVLLGPVFIPFFIVPKMEWLFWGWFKAFLQYSFYPVVANAYLYVFGSMLVHLVDSQPPPYDGPAIAPLFAPLLFLLIAFVYGAVKIPSLVSSLFSGSSGESVIPKIP